jgi:hypothetical protein
MALGLKHASTAFKDYNCQNLNCQMPEAKKIPSRRTRAQNFRL